VVELLAGALVLLVVMTGTATLSDRPVLILVGALLGGAVLLLTRGREIRARRRAARRPAATAGQASARPVAAGGDASPGPVAAGRDAPAGPVTDVVPEDALTAVPLDGRTAAAVTFGTAGLFLFNILFGPLAIGLGVAALRRGAPGRWGRPAALAGVLLGAADLLVLVILLLTRISGDGFEWHS
jgi:hypothetical protein